MHWANMKRKCSLCTGSGTATESKEPKVKFACIKGGKQFQPWNKERKTLTFKQECPAFIHFALSDCNQFLEVSKMNEEHNHTCTKSQFETLPQQRLKFEKSESLKDCLSIRGNEKLIQQKIVEQTGCLVTLKDITNLSRKPKGRLHSRT